jgi:hypothetical protein
MFLDKFKKKVKTRQETSEEVRIRTHHQAMPSGILDHCAIRPET